MRPAWPTWQNPVSTKNTKIIQAWWCRPVISATQEAEAGESSEPRGRGCSEPRSHHCTPAWVRETLSQKKKKERGAKDFAELVTLVLAWEERRQASYDSL